MFDKFRKFFKKEEFDEKYVVVPENEMNEELKIKIVELEKSSDEWSKVLQSKYANIFESQGKQNLKIWVCRDIDGDEKEDLTSEHCLEQEYRSQIAIDYDGPKFDDDFYADTIYLWCYFRRSGTLYDLSKNDLKTEIEVALKTLLST